MTDLNKTVDRNAKLWIAIGAVFAAIAVAIGAVGAHGLEKMIAEMDDIPKRVANWNTGFRYQMYHSIGLIVVGLLIQVLGPRKMFTLAAMLMVMGIILFSGCLYGWVFLDNKTLVMIVPLGGLSFILSWLCVSAGVFFGGNDQ